MKLATEFDDVALGEFQLGRDGFFDAVDIAFNVARAEVNHECGAALAAVALDGLDGLQRGKIHRLAER